MFDCFYFTSLAWICDLFPEGHRRSKRLGIFVGVVGGIAFTVGVPLGAIIATLTDPTVPFIVSPFVSALCVLLLVVVPVDDTLGVKQPQGGEHTDVRLLWGNRGVPRDFGSFLASHFPISLGSIDIMKKAAYPMDWMTNWLMHICSSLANMILIQYCLAVLGWTAPLAAVAVLSVGLCLGIFAPPLMHRYKPIGLAFYGMCMFSLGLALLSIAGTGIDRAPVLGACGIVSIALGASWVPSLQTHLTSQYERDVQGMKDYLPV